MKLAIIHGKKLKKNGELHEEHIYRIEKGIELYKNGTVDLIAVSGGRTRRNYISEAEKAFNYLLDEGIPRHLIIKFPTCLTTIDEARNLDSYVQKNKQVNKVFVVSSSWVMPRVKHVYKKFFSSSISLKFVASRTTDFAFYIFTEPFASLFTLLYVQSRVYDTILNSFKIIFRNA